MKLYKIENRIGIYWVVANDPTEAENKLLKIFNKENYGFSDHRKTITITVIAEQIVDQFLSGKHLVI